MCGEMGAMPQAIPLLVGLGVTELSVTPGALPKAKATVQSVDRREAADLARAALDCATADEVLQLVQKR